MAIAYDAAVIGTFLRFLAVKFKQCLFQLLEKLLCNVLKYQNMIRCRACLTAIEPTAKSNPPSGHSEVCGGMNNRGIFASELEHNRCKILCSRTHYNLCDFWSAGEKNVIPLLF